jgi:hypothetical protein
MQNIRVELVIRAWDGSRVAVRDPMENVAASPPGWPESWIGHDVTTYYPDEFPQAARLLRSGEYVVRLVGPREEVRGSCTFRIPEGEPGWFCRFESIHVEDEDHITVYVQPGQGARHLKALQCEIHAPREPAGARPARAKFGDYQPGEVLPQATYPKDFDGGRPLMRGAYWGEWTAWDPAYAVGAQGRRTLVRRFAFEWPSLDDLDADALSAGANG